MMLVMNEFGEPDLWGWWLGLIIGFVVVVVVVVVVGLLLWLASRIAGQAEAAARGLEATRAATQPISGLHRTDYLLRSVLSGAATAREAVQAGA